MIFFFILVNIIVASLLSSSQANNGGSRQGQAATVSLPKVADRPFWAARGRRSGWAVSNVDTAIDDSKSPNEEDYGYMEQVEEDPHTNAVLWNSRLKQSNENFPPGLIESLGESHTPLRPRRYSNGAGPTYGEIVPVSRKPVSPFQEFFSMWLNQIKRNVAAETTTEASRPFWAARG